MSPERTIEITAEEDRFWVAGETRRFAAELGFSPAEQARLAVCVAELASNAAKHAGRGRIELAEVTAPPRTPDAPMVIGCRVRAIDEGPGIAAVDDALRDGFSEGRPLTPDTPLSERRGLGIGLGAVCRLMSEVRVISRSGGGLLIEAVLWRSSEPGLRTEEERTCRRA
ncbi:Anti-sigma B factor RsbT [Minicystis rosea]|nr:Anti-sigma B factor RsbT [Minicystis rosea]